MDQHRVESARSTQHAALRGAGLLLLVCGVLSGCGGEGQNPLPEAVQARAARAEETPAPPRIAAQPQPLLVADGEPAMFAVQVQGRGPLRYQWQREGSDIAGAQGPVLVIAAAQRADDGARFTVVVQGPGGQVRSEPVQLHVDAAGTSTRF
jgi:hypothetical protein